MPLYCQFKWLHNYDGTSKCSISPELGLLVFMVTEFWQLAQTPSSETKRAVYPHLRVLTCYFDVIGTNNLVTTLFLKCILVVRQLTHNIKARREEK